MNSEFPLWNRNASFGISPITSRLDQRCQSPRKLLGKRGLLGLTLPNHDHPPAELAQIPGMNNIPRSISLQLRQPPLASVRWRRTIPAALVPMPKASVHKNHRLVFSQNNIRPTRQPLTMEPKTKSHAVQR
jgi:hypothetical protein